MKFKDSGHILGSSLIDIRTTDPDNYRKIVFCGDMGRPSMAILRDPAQIYDVDYLVMESTYGDRLHEKGDFTDEFVRVINESIERGGVLVIPSFSVGRTQTLLYILRDLEEAGKIPEIPIYMDSPMALEATVIYEKRMANHDLEARTKFINGKKVFHPKNLHLCESRGKSKAINEIKKNAIIISASGMVTGGRIMHHMEQRLPEPKNTILFVGYQAEGTRGRIIVEGNDSVKIHGRAIPIRAHIENITGLSGHADYNEILAWLMGFNKAPKKTFIVHGESHASESLAQKITAKFGWDVVIPKFGESHLIDL
jgi:metallo-beta-lactamase family protein